MAENILPIVINKNPRERKNMADAFVFKKARIDMTIKIRPRMKRKALTIADIIFHHISY